MHGRCDEMDRGADAAERHRREMTPAPPTEAASERGEDVAAAGGPMRWRSGTTVVQQEYWRQKLVGVRPVTVVEDRADLLALYSPAGAPFRFARWQTGRRQDLSVEERLRVYLSPAQQDLEERPTRAHVLTLNPPGAWHSFKLFWDRDWRLETWYVNLEAPFERLPDGIIHRDLFLDLAVAPSLAWAWKDEDEFEALRAAGGLDAEEYERVRREASRMVALVEARGWPFESEWPRWRPNPAWPPPVIPPDWRLHPG